MGLEVLTGLVEDPKRPNNYIDGDILESKTAKTFDILPDLKDGDSSCETLMSERKNIQCGIYIPIMERTALHALPFSYSKTCPTFRTTTA